MLDIGTGLRVRRRVLLVLLVLLVGLALPLVGGCSSDPECFVVPFLPTCFDDDDEEEEKPDDMAMQAVVPRPLDASSLRLAWLCEDIVPRDDGCHLDGDRLNWAIRCSLEAIRAGLCTPRNAFARKTHTNVVSFQWVAKLVSPASVPWRSLPHHCRVHRRL